MNGTPENANNSGATDLETLDYLHGVKSSTCLLLSSTPSPIPLDFKHPLSEELSEQPFLGLNEDPDISNVQTDASAGDSSSSADSNSVVQDPVSAQLINNISMLDYQTLSKNGDLIIGQTEECKLDGSLKIKNRKLPGFVNWNWCIIRKTLLWVVVSVLIACLASIIAMIVTIPKVCNPDLPWYQGKVFYEVFPTNSNNDEPDFFKGLIKKLDYMQDVGISAIRLNYIFEVNHFSDNYNNISSLLQIDKNIGVLNDLKDLIVEVHSRNMSLVLDIPVISMAIPVSTDSSKQAVLVANDTLISYSDATSAAITYWARSQNVDGFYLKNLENFVLDVNFGKTLQIWKQIIGNNKILIANEKACNIAKGDSLNILLSRVDLIDIHLNLDNGITSLKNRMDEIITGILWEKPYYPWVHWNIGNVKHEEISNNLNNTLAFTVLDLVLPGTISIFYNDEFGSLENDTETNLHNLSKDINDLGLTFGRNENNHTQMLHNNTTSNLEPRDYLLNVIKHVIKFRLNTPTLYLKGIYKGGKTTKNMKIRKTVENLVVIERSYPRRNTCVFVGNLGNISITTDLSSMFYGGTVVAGTNTSLIGETLYFDNVTFPPNSAFILKMEK